MSMQHGPGGPGRREGRARSAAQQRLTRLAGLVPAGSSSAARTPFVLLVVVLLGAGMLALLLLNASLNEGSFELEELQRRTQELSDERQQLQAEVDAYSAPDALAERARELGMVPGGPPAFLGPGGSVLGDAEPEPAPSPLSSPPSPSGAAAPSPSAPPADPGDAETP